MTEFSFERAVREKIRFTVKSSNVNGNLYAEDLYDLPLSHGNPNVASLDMVANSIADELAKTKVSFVAKASPANDINTYKLDLVKQVIAYKQQQIDDALKAKSTRQTVSVIDEAIERKKLDKLNSMTVEELEAMRASI